MISKHYELVIETHLSGAQKSKQREHTHTHMHIYAKYNRQVEREDRACKYGEGMRE